MKKHRKVGNTTSTNFYTSQFHLKSTQFAKQPRQRKINTTFSNFKHQLFQQQSKSQQRYRSKDTKPQIQQLKFLTTKQDDFKLPLSVTKRSMSKTKEQSRLKIETKSNQLYEQHFQEIPSTKQGVEKKTPYYQFAAAIRMKQSNIKNPLKQKLERTALQKFNQAVLKENEENQNIVSQKNAESLYQLLKTARLNQLKHQNFKLHSLPQEIEGGETQQVARNHEIVEQKRSYNFRKQSQSSYVEQSQNEASRNRNIKEVIKSKDNLFKNIDQQAIPQQTEQNPRPYVPNPQVSIPKQQPQTQVIKFQKVECDQIRKQTFTSSENDESFDFGGQLNEESKISYNRNSQNQKEIIARSNENKKPIPAPSQINNQKTRKQSIKLEQKSHKVLQSEDQKRSTNNKINPEPKKAEAKLKRYEQSDLDSIPNGQAFDKPAHVRQVQGEKPRKSSTQFVSLNANKIEKVLTPKHLEQPTIKTAPKINPPPKLNNFPEQKQAGVKPSMRSHPIQDDDELEQVTLGNEKNIKKEEPPKKSIKQILQVPPPKPKQQKKVVEQKKVQAINQEIQKSSDQHEEEESGDEISDELTYYIERIEDVGQYRINSKDVYSDKSIDKELLQIHKICAYYMAHQFLYLAQWTCTYFKGNSFINDFYTLTPEDLQQLKENGFLEGQIENLSENIESSKKLLKKCYDECKAFLPKQEQILMMDGKTNFHIRCCATLIKQFKKVYELFQKSPKNKVMVQRCVYLIEIYCTLKLLNGEELKQFEQFQEIQNPILHIETHKKHLLSL